MNKRIIALIALLLLPLPTVYVAQRQTAVAAPRAEPEPQGQRQRRGRRRTQRRPARRAPVDYSKFNHSTPEHRKACDSCHTIPTPNWQRVRPSREAFPDVTEFPDHPSCVNCHQQQWFRGAQPVICSVCHTNVSPRNGARFPFDNPREHPGAKAGRAKDEPSEFSTIFPHDRHQDVMAMLRPSFKKDAGLGFVRAAYRQEPQAETIDNCSICHRTDQPPKDLSKIEYLVPPPENLPDDVFWLKKGTLKKSPSSHASCFNCHWQDGGEKPLASDCAGCHKLSPPARASSPATEAGDGDGSIPSAKGITDGQVLAEWVGRKSAKFIHEHPDHLKRGCTDCHVAVTGASRLGSQISDVSILTCSSGQCHGATKGPKAVIYTELRSRLKPDGADFKCTKCHLVYSASPRVPESHLNLFPELRPK